MRARLVAVLVVTIASSAHADPPGMTPNLPPPPPIAAAPSDLDQLTHNDAAASHGFAFDSGLVLGTGDVAISLLTLVENASNLNVSVGVGGGVELSVDGSDGLGGRFYGLGGGVRVQLARGPRYAISIAGGYHWASEGVDDESLPYDTYLTFGGDLALAVTDRLLMSFGLGVLHDDTDGDSTTSFYGHVDLVYGRSRFRFLAEVGDVGTPIAALGVRYASRYVSVDLGIGATGLGDDVVSTPVVVFGLTGRP